MSSIRHTLRLQEFEAAEWPMEIRHLNGGFRLESGPAAVALHALMRVDAVTGRAAQEPSHRARKGRRGRAAARLAQISWEGGRS
jgi:hypothetical protein